MTFTAKNVPPFCEIWFVSKGRHIWTREASEFTDDLLPVLRPDESVNGEIFWLNLQDHNVEPLLHPECPLNSFFGADLQGSRGLNQNESNNSVVMPTAESCVTCTTKFCSSQEPSLAAASWHSSPSVMEFLSEIISKVCTQTLHCYLVKLLRRNFDFIYINDRMSRIRISCMISSKK